MSALSRGSRRGRAARPHRRPPAARARGRDRCLSRGPSRGAGAPAAICRAAADAARGLCRAERRADPGAPAGRPAARGPAPPHSSALGPRRRSLGPGRARRRRRLVRPRGRPALLVVDQSAVAAAAARTTTAAAIEAYRVYSVEVRHPVEVAAARKHISCNGCRSGSGGRWSCPIWRGRFSADGRAAAARRTAPAAQLMYQDGKGTRLTVYLRAGFRRRDRLPLQRENGIGTFYWSDDGFGYAITAKADRAMLLKIAEIIYRQTSRAKAARQRSRRSLARRADPEPGIRFATPG